MRNLIFGALLSTLFLSGCGEITYKYIYPKYSKIKTVEKIKPATVRVDTNNQATAKSTTSMVNTIRAHKIKENYYDGEIYKWNQLADKKNIQAEEHNSKLEKEEKDIYGINGLFDR